MAQIKSLMAAEAEQAPQVVERQLQENKRLWQELFNRLKSVDIPLVMTVARGSSDHAATFAKYLFETQMGLVTASAAPSITTIYHSRQKLKNCLVIAVSQSGESPDICEVISAARQQGAITVALVNQTTSPLARLAEYVIPLWAGEEKAVAATKSYLASLAALLQGIAIGTNNKILQESLEKLPDILEASYQMSWEPAFPLLQPAADLLVIGRGYGFPIAQEAALKCKEVAALHAEAFSSAEVRHGPMALVKSHLPVLSFCQNDETFPGIISLIDTIRRLQGKVILALPDNLRDSGFQQADVILPLPKSVHGLMDPLMAIQAFYKCIAELAQLRGLNPDQPANLQKITKTR